MKSRMQWLALALILTFAVGGWVTAGTSRMMAAPTSVAAVDLQKVLNSLKEKEQINADLQTRADQLKQQEQEKQRELQQLQEDLEILAPGAEAFQAKQEELEQKVMELQAWRAFQTRKIEMERTLQLERMYQKIVDACGSVATQNGYHMVLYKEPSLNLRRAKPEDAGALIASRKLIWAANDLDLTDQVVTMMNNDFVNLTK